MPLLDLIKQTRKVIPDPIIATKVTKEVQESFDQLAEKTYNVTRSELLRASVHDCLMRHEEAKQK